MTDGEAGHAWSRRDGSGGRAGTAIDPVCGMKVDHSDREASVRARRPPGLLSARRAAARSSIAAPRTICPRARPAAGAGGHDLHLSRCIPRSARTAREAARSAAWRWNRSSAGRGRAERRADRHEPPLLDRPRARAAGRGAGDGRAYPGSATARSGAAAARPSCCSSSWPRRSCCGLAGRFSSAPGPRSCIAASTCSR